MEIRGFFFMELMDMKKTSGTKPARPRAIRRQWRIGNRDRHALIYPVAKSAKSAPVVFIFHGHTGTVEGASRNFNVQSLWPEAIVVYLQGVNTPGKFDREGKKPGWQHFAGDEGDRDVKFFDAVWADLKKDFRIDESRIYAGGHSNGGQFVYVLWQLRADLFAAFAASAGVPMKSLLERAPVRSILKLEPKPIMQIGGRKDPALSFEWTEQTVEQLRKLNKCSAAKRAIGSGTLYSSRTGADVLAYFYPGGHPFPPESMPATVKFFKQHRKIASQGSQ